MSGVIPNFSRNEHGLEWLLLALKTLLPGLREQNDQDYLTLESFHSVVGPFLQMAQLSPADRKWFATAPVQEQGVGNELPASCASGNNQQQQKVKRIRPIEFDEDAWYNDPDVFAFISGKRQKLRQIASDKEVEYADISGASIRDRVLASQALRDLMEIRASLDMKAEFARKQAEIARKKQEQKDIDALGAMVTDLRNKENLDLQAFYRVVAPSLPHPERVFDLEMMTHHQPQSQASKSNDRDPSPNSGDVQKAGLLLEMTRSTARRPPAIEVRACIRRSQHFHVLVNIRQSIDDWGWLCGLLDTATTQSLRSFEFREECAAWSEKAYESALFSDNRGVRMLSLPWSSVDRFVKFLRAWLLANPEMVENEFIREIVRYLNLLNSHRNADTTANKKLKAICAAPRQHPSDVKGTSLYRLLQEEAVVTSLSPNGYDPSASRSKYYVYDADKAFMQAQRRKEEDRDWAWIQKLPTLPKRVGKIVYQAPHSKTVYIRRSVEALRVLVSVNRDPNGGNTSQTRRAREFMMYSGSLLELCRGFYTLLKFQTPPAEYLFLASSVRPLIEIFRILQQAKASDAAGGTTETTKVDGFEGSDRIEMVEFVLDLLVEAQFPSHDWVERRLQVTPSGAWFTGGTSAITTGDADVSFDVAGPTNRDYPIVIDEDDIAEGCPIESESDSESICSGYPVVEITKYREDPHAKPALVCSSWVKSYDNKKPQIPPQCTTRYCTRLHPDLEQPGLCTDWLNNRCNDVDCDLAHEDPLYPRNMHVSFTNPDAWTSRSVVCSYWQSASCTKSDCRKLHYLPSGQSNFKCSFYAIGKCRNEHDRCKNLHDSKAPLRDPSLYYSDFYDPLSPVEQPDRRHLNEARPSSGGGVRILCRNMLQTGWCWRGKECWLEHDTAGVQVTYTKYTDIPDTLTITELCLKPGCRGCRKHHRGPKIPPRGDPNDPDVCPRYFKFGYCFNLQNGQCNFKRHIPYTPRIDGAKCRTPAANTGSGVALGRSLKGDGNQSGLPAQTPATGGPNILVNPDMAHLQTPEMLAAAMNQAYFNSLSNIFPARGRNYGNPNSNSLMGAYGTQPIPTPIGQQQHNVANQAGPVCYYCRGIGHIQRFCPQKLSDSRGQKSSYSGGGSSAFGQYQTPVPFAQRGHTMPHATPSTQFTQFSPQFSPNMSYSTPLTGPFPSPHNPSAPNSRFGPDRQGQGAISGQMLGTRDIHQINASPTPAPRPNTAQQAPQVMNPGQALASRITRDQTQPRSKRKANDVEHPASRGAKRHHQSQPANKRKASGIEHYASPDAKRHRSGK
ncbi:hypothetical protein SLS60_002246 [Paraconiothyrium brasiliense]|uniref:C3H1-type domain-containing protein n=1 Tax=Paraconiothyrium brasiliense TaxID=300254 RepID=A0ABR3S1L2_9PLEO